jgi:hypothetical protein
MENSFYFRDRVLLCLPDWNPKATVLEITTRFIGTINLPPGFEFDLYKAEEDGEPCWWTSPDLPVRYYLREAPIGVELQIPLFQIAGKTEKNWVTYKQIDFVCREIYCDKIHEPIPDLEKSGTGIMLDVQLEFIKRCRPLKQTPLQHSPSSLLN